ncbi:MAG: TadE/TadG family type IV pilus assembly protein [Candidatus Limnocylindrales bacterium]
MSPRRAARYGNGRGGQSGQALYEFAIMVPIFLLILLAALEFGFVFWHNQTLEYASREGARAGAAMANGSQTDKQCNVNGATVGGANVDPLIIAAVQRVLESPGSPIDMGQIQQITIYKADPATGADDQGAHNIWTYRPANMSNPLVPCEASAPHLDFYESSHGWDACGSVGNGGTFKAPCGTAGALSYARNNGAIPDSIGVSITYNYKAHTPFGGILAFLGGHGWSTLPMSDKTVMALEPTS